MNVLKILSCVVWCFLIVNGCLKKTVSGQRNDDPNSSQGNDVFGGDLMLWSVKRTLLREKSLTYYTKLGSENPEENLGENVLFESLGKITTMAADYHAKRFYYNDKSLNSIGIYDSATKEHHRIFQGMAWGIDSLSVDWVSGNVYWTDINFQWIMVADRNFSYYRNIIQIESQGLAKLVVHPGERYVYWTEQRHFDSLIWRSDLEGNNHELLHTFVDVLLILDITIDFSTERLYWTELMRGSNSISRIRFFPFSDEGDVQEVYSSSSSHFFALEIYKDHLHVTDDFQKRMLIIDKNTNAVVKTHSFPHTDVPRGLAMYSLSAQPISKTDANHVCRERPCQHICIALFGMNRYLCDCKIGFTLQNDGRTCRASIVQDNFAILLDKKHSKLYQMSLMTNDPQEIHVSGVSAPSSAAYDPLDKMVYWADEKARLISRATLFGAFQETLVNGTAASSLVLDPGADNMYWLDTERNAVYVSKLNGSFAKLLLINGLIHAGGMAIDTKRGFLYWSDQARNGPQRGVIERARLDGQDRSVIIQANGAPNALAIDVEGNMLYWTEVSNNSIGWYDVANGSKGYYVLPFSSFPYSLTGLSYREGDLFISDESRKHLMQVSASDVTDQNDESPSSQTFRSVGPSIYHQLSGIYIFSNGSFHQGSSVCFDTKCPQLCLPNDLDTNGFSCACQDHFAYNAQTNACNQVASTEDEEPPTFGSSCPQSFQVFTDDCKAEAAVDFVSPVATDNSGEVIVKHLMNGEPPYYLREGSTNFVYFATDKSGNTANCSFDVRVTVRVCYDLPDVPEGAEMSEKSCEDQVGSIINVTCPGVNAPSFQLKCGEDYTWVSVGDSTCEKSGSTDAETIENHSNLTIGLVIAIVVFIVVLVLVIFVIYHRRKGKPFTSGSQWTRVADRVQLTGASTESGIYLGDRPEEAPQFGYGELKVLHRP